MSLLSIIEDLPNSFKITVLGYIYMEKQGWHNSFAFLELYVCNSNFKIQNLIFLTSLVTVQLDNWTFENCNSNFTTMFTNCNMCFCNLYICVICFCNLHICVICTFFFMQTSNSKLMIWQLAIFHFSSLKVYSIFHYFIFTYIFYHNKYRNKM